MSYRRFVTAPTPAGVKGDMRPEPATIGTKLRHFGRSATTVGVAVSDGGQNGRQAFAADRREGPT